MSTHFKMIAFVMQEETLKKKKERKQAIQSQVKTRPKYKDELVSLKEDIKRLEGELNDVIGGFND